MNLTQFTIAFSFSLISFFSIFMGNFNVRLNKTLQLTNQMSTESMTWTIGWMPLRYPVECFHQNNDACCFNNIRHSLCSYDASLTLSKTCEAEEISGNSDRTQGKSSQPTLFTGTFGTFLFPFYVSRIMIPLSLYIRIKRKILYF